MDRETEDPAELLAMLDAERAKAVRALQPDPRVIYGVWGTAWLVGFLIFFSSASEDSPVRMPLWTAGALFGLCIVSAIAITIVHIGRRSAGVRGVSSQVGAMYGWSWFLALTGQALILNAQYQYGLTQEVAAVLWSSISGLVVGTLYMAGGALWQDRLQFRLGIWILLSSVVGSFAGYPAVYLVMAFMGGGGFLLGAVYYALRGQKSLS